MTARAGLGNRYAAIVESVHRRDAYAWLRVSKRGRLAARLFPGIRAGARVDVSVRPEDVVLCAAHPGATSARNVLLGPVRSVRDVAAGVAVTLDVGFPLTALVTRRALADVDARRGRALFALVKAMAVATEPAVAPATAAGGAKTRAPDRYEVVPIGKGGALDRRALDLLAAIDREGSISAAARALGIAYRTAWLRIRAASQIWGRPLIAAAPGGRGGGGAALTPEGRAVLERIERRGP